MWATNCAHTQLENFSLNSGNVRITVKNSSAFYQEERKQRGKQGKGRGARALRQYSGRKPECSGPPACETYFLAWTTGQQPTNAYA